MDNTSLISIENRHIESSSTGLVNFSEPELMDCHYSNAGDGISSPEFTDYQAPESMVISAVEEDDLVSGISTATTEMDASPPSIESEGRRTFEVLFHYGQRRLFPPTFV